jgi:hypothetical protein
MQSDGDPRTLKRGLTADPQHLSTGQDCGSGSVLGIRIPVLRIPDPYWKSGSRIQGQGISVEKCTLVKILSLKRYKIALTTYFLKIFLMKTGNTGIFELTQILISENSEKEIVFKSSVLAWIRIRIEQKCWIRIRIKSIRIHNLGTG